VAAEFGGDLGGRQMLAIVGFKHACPVLCLFFLRDDLGVHSTALDDLVRRAQTRRAPWTMMICAPIWGHRGPLRPQADGRAGDGVRFVLATLSSFAQHRGTSSSFACSKGDDRTVSASVAFVASSVPKERLGFSLGLMQMAVFSGASIGPFVGRLPLRSARYRHTLWVSGALLGLGGLVALVFAHEDFKPQTFNRDKAPLFLTTTRGHLNNKLLLVLIGRADARTDGEPVRRADRAALRAAPVSAAKNPASITG